MRLPKLPHRRCDTEGMAWGDPHPACDPAKKVLGFVGDAKLGVAMPNDKEVFSRQVFLLILGVLVGAVPTLFITTFQLRYQSRQALREKQITVLHDLAVSINEGGKVIAKYHALDASIFMLPDVPTQQERNDFVNRVNEADAELTDWIADMRTQGIVMESVFGVSLPVLDFRPVLDITLYPATSRAEGKQQIESAEHSIHSLTTDMIALMDSEQKILTNIAQLVAKER